MECRAGACEPTRYKAHNLSPAKGVEMEVALLSWVRWILVVSLSLGALMPGYEAKPADVDTYMVLLEGKPVVGYKGEIPGLRGTAKYFTNNWKKHHRRYVVPSFTNFKVSCYVHLLWCTLAFIPIVYHIYF